MAVVLVGLAMALAAAAQVASAVGHDYRQALSKSILYFEAQRSGRLPGSQRVAWRADSGLLDGKANGVRVTDPRPDLLSLFLDTYHLLRAHARPAFFLAFNLETNQHFLYYISTTYMDTKTSICNYHGLHLHLPFFLVSLLVGRSRWIWWAATTTPATTSSSACRWRSR
jgi:hypothetical protein